VHTCSLYVVYAAYRSSVASVVDVPVVVVAEEKRIISVLYYYMYVTYFTLYKHIYFRNSSLFTATCKNSPSARCVTAATRVFKHTDIFRMPTTSLRQILR
jgi:hypothetical protein